MTTKRSPLLPPSELAEDKEAVISDLDSLLREGHTSLREIARQNGMRDSAGVAARLRSYGIGVNIFTYLYDLETGLPIKPVQDKDLFVLSEEDWERERAKREGSE